MDGSATQRSKRRLVMVLGVGLVGLIVFFILYLTTGQVKLGFTDALGALGSYISKSLNSFISGTPAQYTITEQIVGQIRFPRAIAVVGVGIALSVAGAVMQAMIRNPLVDPYITGSSSGAAVGATVVMLMGVSLVGVGIFSVPIAAFIGALLAFAFTMSLAEASGGRALNYVLAGIVTGTALTSVVTLLLTYSPNHIQGPVFWMFGSFNGIDWTQALLIIVPTLLMALIALLYARDLNVILLGHEQAYQLGVDSRKFRRWMMILASLLTAVAVAFVGIIAFLGLIVPHIARIILGGDHRLLLPASMIIGANVLLVADIIARTVSSSGELPVGAIISLIGAPFFGYLLVRKGRQYAG
jgi:iron complex transport system permease protein